MDLPVERGALLDERIHLGREIFLQEPLKHAQFLKGLRGVFAQALEAEVAIPQGLQQLGVPVVKHDVVLAIPVERGDRTGVILEVDDRRRTREGRLAFADKFLLQRLAPTQSD